MHKATKIYLKYWAAVCTTEVFLCSRPTAKLIPRGCVSVQRISAPYGIPHMYGSPKMCVQLLGPYLCPSPGPTYLCPLSPGHVYLSPSHTWDYIVT